MTANSRGESSRISFALIALIALFLASAPANAEMKDRKICKVLAAEHAELLSTGLKDDMSNGPYWALENLSSGRIEKIARFLELDEIIMFQCPDGHKPEIKKKPKIKKKKAAPGKKKKIIRKKNIKKKKKTSSADAGFHPFSGN